MSEIAHRPEKLEIQPIQVQFQHLQFDVPAPRSKNPFKKREETIELSDLEFGSEDKPSLHYKRILHKMTASFEPGTLTAIIGSSGAGKTTLLNVLAGRASGKLSGTIFVNGQQIDEVKKSLQKHQAYVMQDDVLLATQTPMEILEFAAKLRLPTTMNSLEKNSRVLQVIAQLNLSKCKDTKVGAPGVARGVSGGERKRVSIAQELLTNPSLLFLDEPTSGLDAFTAEIIIDCLKDLANAGRTIVFTIHQPNSQIFAKFDRLMILAKGEIVYWGSAHKSPEYFEALGHPVPGYSNPADFFMKLLHVGSDTKNEDVVDQLISSYKKSNQKNMMEKKHPLLRLKLGGQSNNSPNFLMQGGLIAKRNIVDILRSPTKIRANLFQTIFLSTLVGLIYLQQSFDASSIQNRVGAVYFAATNMLMSGMSSVVNTFANDKVVFFREHSNHMYSTGAYYYAKILSDLPFQVVPPIIYGTISYWMIGLNPSGVVYVLHILAMVVLGYVGSCLGLLLGVAAKDAATATILVPVSIIPFMIFSGFLINNDNIPVYFIWLNYISPMRWGFQAMMTNIFADLTFTCAESEKVLGRCLPFETGQQLLNYYKMNDGLGYWYSVLILFGFIVFLRLITFVILFLKAKSTKLSA